MSKKAKGSSAKKSSNSSGKKPAPKKAVAKKIVKKVAKPAAKKLAPKKNAPVKPKAVKKANNSKKVVAAKKTLKPVKKVVAKKVVAKPVKKTKVVAKPAPKKVTKAVIKKAVAKTVKPITKKPEPKKTVAPTPAKAEKVVTKPIIASKPIVKELTKAEIKKKEKEAAAADGSDVLAITNTIPKVEREELSASRIASITSSITNPVKKNEAYAIKPEKEPNGKFELEFITRASAEMLYEFLATPSGLSEWFCDDVNIRNGIYTFIWDGQMQQARLLKTIDEQLVRFQWVDKTDGSFFEFRIQRDDLTNDISLIITDFAESRADQESAKLLWNNQVDKLMHVLGSVY